jgi:hypothetical protein
MKTSTPLPRILFVGVTILACATAPRSRPESSRRVPDSAPDKVAAQRAGAGLHLEEEDDRWGFTAARELRQKREPRNARQPTPAAAPGRVDVSQPVDPGAK